jgi:hypothetical protein
VNAKISKLFLNSPLNTEPNYIYDSGTQEWGKKTEKFPGLT